MAFGSSVDPIRTNSPLIRPDRLPVPVRTDARAVVATGTGEPVTAVTVARGQAEDPGRRLIANPIDPMTFQGHAVEEKRQAHAVAEQSYRRTSALGWGVRRTVDFEV